MKNTLINKEVPVLYEFAGIPYEVVHRRVKYFRVEFKPTGLRVIVPRGISPRQMLEDNRDAILKKYHHMRGQMETSKLTPLHVFSSRQFIDIVYQYVHMFCRVLKVPVPSIRYRKMRRRWGSCRSDGVITLNTFLQFVPEHLIGFIIYHEMAHLLIRGHDRKFKALIAAQYPNHSQLDKELKIYGMKMQGFS